MKLTKNNLIKKLGVTNEEVIKLITDYKDKLPILTEEGEGFCVNARDLHRELEVGRDFTTWVKERIKKYDFVNSVDYLYFWSKDGVVFDDDKSGDVNLDINNSNQMVRNGYIKEYCFTMEMSKQLAMVQNNEKGKIARKYFITVEKILKEALKWEKIRKPEKERYKEMCSELKLYFIRNFNKEPRNYDYINEANALNIICLGAKAKEVQEYIDAQDNNTRDWLEAKYNEYLDKMQEINIMYLKMNFNKDRRYDLIKQGFKALYPNSSFLMATKSLQES